MAAIVDDHLWFDGYPRFDDEGREIYALLGSRALSTGSADTRPAWTYDLVNAVVVRGTPPLLIYTTVKT